MSADTEHTTAPTATAIGLKLELWTADDIRLAHAFEWVDDADSAAVRAAVAKLGKKLHKMLKAHLPPEEAEGC